MSSMQKDLNRGLNGSSLEDLNISDKVIKELQSFQDKYYIDADSYIILCDNVELYKEYALFREENLSIDPFCVIENLSDYKNEYNSVVNFYNADCSGIEDSRVVYEDNKYKIRYKDINFDNSGVDIVQYDTFEYWVLEKDITQRTKQEAEIAQNIDFVDYEVEDGKGKYYFYDSLQQTEIVVNVYSLFGFVFNCNIEIGD